MDLTDAELLEAIAVGDRGAHRSLYERHARWVLLRLERRCADRTLVEEVVQDTFLKVWRKAHTFRGDGDVGAWVWGIAIRTLLDGLRRRRPIPMQLVPAIEETVTSAEDELLEGVEHGPLGAALDRLSPELRAVMQATVLDGLTVREASRLLGVPVGTVKTRAMRARKALREGLA